MSTDISNNHSHYSSQKLLCSLTIFKITSVFDHSKDLDTLYIIQFIKLTTSRILQTIYYVKINTTRFLKQHSMKLETHYIILATNMLTKALYNMLLGV